MKFHALNVKGGEVRKAQRTDKPSNIPWLITVKPHGTGDVTIVLPPTTNCGAQGAICTGDGKKLSGMVELTVNGPEKQSQERQNNPTTGDPAIGGTPRVGETLTAGTSAISDEDGLDNVSYRYQWLRDDADIAGQTSSTYRLVSADEGKTIRVRVSFTDDADNQETLTSAATTAVAAQPTPAVLLTASFANVPADHNGENFTFQLTFSGPEGLRAGD